MTQKNPQFSPNIITPGSRNDSMTANENNWQITQRKKHNWRPPTDVYETDTDFIIKVEIAGMNENDFNLVLDKNTLLIQGSRIDKKKDEKRAFHQVEIGFGEFSTQIKINSPIDQENTRANYTNGFLTISLPKSTPKQIKIKR